MFRAKKRVFIKKILHNVLVVVACIALTLLLLEGLLRLKNSNHMSYAIEMWRYTKTLKVRSQDPLLGFEHRSNRSAVLQGIEIRLNSLGMRGPEIAWDDHSKKRILFLGSSNTLGWGVEEKKIIPSLLQDALKNQAVVLNGGIGNYNASRYVRLFKTKLRKVRPDIVVIQYFIRDAEILKPGAENWFLRNSELAVTLDQVWQLSHLNTSMGSGLIKHYKDCYRDDSLGFQQMVESLSQMDAMAKEDGFKVVFMMTPDSHYLKDFPYSDVHEKMKSIIKKLGWTFIDPTEQLRTVPQQELWVMPTDPHYNAKGHKMMADVLLPYLKRMLSQ